MQPGKERSGNGSHDIETTYDALGRLLLVVGFSAIVAALGPRGHFAEILSLSLIHI